MSKLALLAAGSLFLLGTTVIACAPGAPDEPTQEEAGEDEAGASQFCGGIAGFQCAAGKVCVDDPTDDCDPNNGGADCGGVCRGGKPPKKPQCKNPDRRYVATSPEQCMLVKFFCEPGTEMFSDACGCGCETSTATTPCGPNTCGGGQVCCNASCGICTAPGDFCIQLACEPV